MPIYLISMMNINQTILSNCRSYRYILYRKNPLSSSNKSIVFVMINPSTADENINDATIKKCLKIAEHHDCEHIYVVNLIPYRSKDVNEVEEFINSLSNESLTKMNQDNWNYINGILEQNKDSIIICGWGKYDKVNGTYHQAYQFYQKYKNFNLKCLKVNKDESPKHPLFVKSTSVLINFNPDNLKMQLKI